MDYNDKDKAILTYNNKRYVNICFLADGFSLLTVTMLVGMIGASLLFGEASVKYIVMCGIVFIAYLFCICLIYTKLDAGKIKTIFIEKIESVEDCKGVIFFDDASELKIGYELTYDNEKVYLNYKNARYDLDENAKRYYEKVAKVFGIFVLKSEYLHLRASDEMDVDRLERDLDTNKYKIYRRKKDER